MDSFWKEVIEEIQRTEPGTAAILASLPCHFYLNGKSAFLEYRPEDSLSAKISYTEVEVKFIWEFLQYKSDLLKQAISQVKAESVIVNFSSHHSRQFNLKDLTGKEKILNLTKMQIRIMQKIGGWDIWNSWEEHDWIDLLEPADRLWLAKAVLAEIERIQSFSKEVANPYTVRVNQDSVFENVENE